MTIESVAVCPIDFSLDEPFEISLGIQTDAENLLVRVETDDGIVGYGEGAPLGPITGETQRSAVALAEAGADLLEGRRLEDRRGLVEELHDALPGAVSALFALETALFDAYCRDAGIPLAACFGGAPRSLITDITISIVHPADAAMEATRVVDRGFDRLKVKVGTDPTADLARLESVRDAAPDVQLTVDANQGWTPKEAIRFAADARDRALEISLLEQPVHRDDLSGLARVTAAVDVPVAADEAVFTPQDALHVAEREAADVITIKGGKSGLIRGAAIAEIARAANLDLMVGCMLESALGLHASAHLAAGIGGVAYVDLDGNQSMVRGLEDERPTQTLDIAGPGHGIVPESERLPDGFGP